MSDQDVEIAMSKEGESVRYLRECRIDLALPIAFSVAHIRMSIADETENALRFEFQGIEPVDKTSTRSWGTIPTSFDDDIGEERIGAAVTRCLELDGLLKRRFQSGHCCSVHIPIKGMGSSRSSPPQKVEQFWNRREKVGSLIRPLFLKEADTSVLFPYQKLGVKWLLGHECAILADDMGLGKTVQAITALRILFREGRVFSTLLLCPKSLVSNWQSELQKWAPELTQCVVTPTSSAKHEAWAAIAKRVHVCITNYEQLRDVPAVLISPGVDIVLADEAHRIRNISSQVTQGVRQIARGWFWALTGTPVERDAEDLATLLSTIEPSKFSLTDSRLRLGSLRSLAQPYVLRRNKAQVLTDLPEVIESTEQLELTDDQRQSYKEILASRYESGADARNAVTRINQLRTICDFDESTGQSSKLSRVMEILDDIRHANEKAIVFSYLLRPLHLLHDLLQSQSPPLRSLVYEGSQSRETRQEVLDEFKNNKEIVALLASSRVAGEGLTLTEANHVIFVNKWWNPSSNAQARDRVVRIGQQRGVRVYSFVCIGTIEEALQKVLMEKGATYAQLIERLADGQCDDPEAGRLVQEIEGSLPTFE